MVVSLSGSAVVNHGHESRSIRPVRRPQNYACAYLLRCDTYYPVGCFASPQTARVGCSDLASGTCSMRQRQTVERDTVRVRPTDGKASLARLARWATPSPDGACSSSSSRTWCAWVI
ncbi:hypothetical protein GCM10009798_05030 [Nocardioides panacihumi]|uniref:Uncharacterized protein n=1 Tax=Nocardioides panacihumi TaxID=400774 RepID=A0ABP5BPB2_9ACTN